MQTLVYWTRTIINGNQTSANRGHDLTIVDEANTTRFSPKPRQSRVIKLMVPARVTRARSKAQVESQVTTVTICPS